MNQPSISGYFQFLKSDILSAIHWLCGLCLILLTGLVLFGVPCILIPLLVSFWLGDSVGFWVFIFDGIILYTVLRYFSKFVKL